MDQTCHGHVKDLYRGDHKAKECADFQFFETDAPLVNEASRPTNILQNFDFVFVSSLSETHDQEAHEHQPLEIHLFDCVLHHEPTRHNSLSLPLQTVGEPFEERFKALLPEQLCNLRVQARAILADSVDNFSPIMFQNQVNVHFSGFADALQ